MFAQNKVMTEAGWGCKRHVAEVSVSFSPHFHGRTSQEMCEAHQSGLIEIIYCVLCFKNPFV